MINYIKSHYGNRPSSKSLIPPIEENPKSTLLPSFILKTYLVVNANERMELSFLREEVRKLKSQAGVSQKPTTILFTHFC
jgi:hypothetical protein